MSEANAVQLVPAWTCFAEQQGATTVVHAIGEVDLYTAPALRAELARAINARPMSVILDFTAAGFMDSACVHVVLDSESLANELDVAFSIRKPSPMVGRVLDLCGL